MAKWERVKSMFQSRIEKKFIMNRFQWSELNLFLDKFASRDSFSKEGSYGCHSYYYDTSSLGYFWDHVNGEASHSKVRIRYYDDGTTFLEVKLKSLEKSFKWRKKVSEGFNPELLSYDSSPLEKEALSLVFTDKLLKKCRVSYQRSSFEMKIKGESLRITLDSDIFVKWENSKDSKRVLAPSFCILELKSLSDLPIKTFREMTSHLMLNETSYSKYCESVKERNHWR